MYKAFITDVDGTLTDASRRLSLSAVSALRRITDAGIPVVFASGNTVCFLDSLAHMIGCDGKIIAENGGAYRNGFTGTLQVAGNRELCMAAYRKIVSCLHPKENELRLFSADLRYSDVAFSRETDLATVENIIAGMDVEAVDTGFAIHLHSPGISKGSAFRFLASSMHLSPADFFAAGDSTNDNLMLSLAGGAMVPANASSDVLATVRKKGKCGYVSGLKYGDAVAEILKEVFL